MGDRLSSPIILARDGELDRLARNLADASDGRPSLTVISGEAGLGKTRLIAEFAARARAAGAIVLAGDCVDLGGGEGLPFAPVAGILRDLVRGLEPEVLEEVVGEAAVELGALVPDLARGHDRGGPVAPDAPNEARLFERFRATVDRLGRRSPCVLVVEDVHWIDDASQALLTYLGRSLRTERVMVVVTFRIDHLHHGHPTFTWLAELDRNPIAGSIRLAPLGDADIHAQLTAILGAAPDPRLETEIAARSEGNPLFVEELLARSGSRDQTPSRTLDDLFLARIAGLSPAAREAVAAAAVVARPVDERLLARLLGVPERRAVQPVREAVDRAVLVPVADRYRFRHALLREAVEADLISGERRDLHVRIATALSADPTLSDPSPAVAAGEIADHWLAADRPTESLRATILAGTAAASVGAHEVADDRYEQAIALTDRLPAVEASAVLAKVGLDQLALRLQAGETAGRVARFGRSTELIRSALEWVDPAVDPARAGLIHSSLSEALWEEGRVGELFAEQAIAIELVPVEPPSVERARVLADSVSDFSVTGRYREAADLARETIAYAERVTADLGLTRATGGPPVRQATRSDPIDFAEALGQATMHLGLALTQLGATAEGIAILRQARIDGESGPLPDVTLHAISNLARCLLTVDELEEAVITAREGLELTDRLGLSAILAARFAWRAGLGLFRSGRWDEADAVTAEWTQHGAQWQVVRSVRARLAGARGDRVLATELLAEGEAGMVEGMDRLLLPQRIAGAEIALAVEGGAGFALDAALDGLDHPYPDLDLRLPLAWLGLRAATELTLDARMRRDRAAEKQARDARTRLLDEVATDRATLLGWDRIPNALAATADLAEAESRRLDGEADPERWRTIADTFASIPEPYPSAYARFRQAEALLVRDGHRADAAEPLGLAAAACRRLGALPLRSEIEGLARRGRVELTDEEAAPPGAIEPEPAGRTTGDARAHPGPVDLGLSARELEVLRLVAAGRTNGEIGRELFITTKTASTHVTHILAKLGVANRLEAAMLAARSGSLDPDPGQGRISGS